MHTLQSHNILSHGNIVFSSSSSILARMQETFEDKDIEKLAQMMAREFSRVEERFDAIDKRFEGVDERFEAIDKRFESVDKRFDKIDNRLETVDHRLEQLEDDVKHIRHNVSNLYNEDFVTRAEFDDTQGRVSYMERKLGIVSGK
jgi:archaellum component FlaC